MKPLTLSRRNFIARASLAASAAFGLEALPAFAAETFPPSIVVFSKVYQELGLGFEAAADLTAEAGLQGVDSPVRPKGEILPERAADQLPLYVEALRKRQLIMPYITTGVLNVDTPHAGELLRVAKKLGIGIYRLGFHTVKNDVPRARQVAEVREQLKGVAAMNKELGLCAIMQNHSPARSYIGGDLAELREIVKDFDPAQIGVAFDFGHAVIVHGDQWRAHFERLKPHVKVAYVKDADRVKKFVKFGEGEYAKSGYFTLLKQMGYFLPFSMHIEFSWASEGQAKSRALLLKTLKESAACVRQWAAQA